VIIYTFDTCLYTFIRVIYEVVKQKEYQYVSSCNNTSYLRHTINTHLCVNFIDNFKTR